MSDCKSYSPIVYLRTAERSFQGRDVTALLHLHPALHRLGYTLGPATLQSPVHTSQPYSQIPVLGNSLADFPTAQAADLLVLTARPPLDDDPSLDKRSIARSMTWLEQNAFAGIRSLISYCSRREVILSEQVQSQLAPDMSNRGRQRYRVYVDGRADRMAEYLVGDTKKVVANTTAGYVLFHPQLPGIGKPLLTMFGMSGDDTLRLAWALANHPLCNARLDALLKSSARRILMIQICKADRPFDNLRPLDVGFEPEVILDAII